MSRDDVDLLTGLLVLAAGVVAAGLLTYDLLRREVRGTDSARLVGRACLAGLGVTGVFLVLLFIRFALLGA